MTVATADWRKVYVGDNSTVAFSFPNKFFANADLVVELKVIATGVTTLQVDPTHYSVTGAGNDAGGTVTMVTAPTTAQQLIISREPSIVQETNLTSGGDLPEEALEDALDLAVMQGQRMATYRPQMFFPSSSQTAISAEADVTVLTAISLPNQPTSVMDGVWEISGVLYGDPAAALTATLKLYGGANGTKADTLKQTTAATWATAGALDQVVLPPFYYIPSNSLHVKVGLSVTPSTSNLDLIVSSTARSYLAIRRVS